MPERKIPQRKIRKLRKNDRKKPQPMDLRVPGEGKEEFGMQDIKAASNPPVTVTESRPDDRSGIGEIALRAKVFSAEEEQTIFELFDEYIQSPDSGYAFLSARVAQQLVGFACWGSTPLTEGTYDLYWICTDPDRYEQGVGRILFGAVETAVRSRSGRLIVIETSTAKAYLPAVRFYQRMGCRQAARIRDFYSPGEDLLIFVKYLSPV
jgi:ribosomal protein S18 acetylase RimI-like enzyme